MDQTNTQFLAALVFGRMQAGETFDQASTSLACLTHEERADVIEAVSDLEVAQDEGEWQPEPEEAWAVGGGIGFYPGLGS